jgi:protein O-GlcNAc transferase
MGSKLEICSLRPAPVQVTYLGFPGTTGAEFIDYVITDKIVTPPDHSAHFQETLVYLPHCYQVNDYKQSISRKEWKKTDVGLPEGSFVFCSFNQAYKLDPLMFNSWMKILQQVSDGVLWLQGGNEATEGNLRRQAEERGLEADKLIFAKHLPKDEHLARLKLADLALDTRIVNGHTTTSDALWAGVPVISIQGTNFASRVSSSILRAIGLPELITSNLEEYEHLAVSLASDPGQLQAIREKIAKNRSVEPLFDTPRFVRNLEKAYKEMWEIFLAGEQPRQIEVVEN